MDEAQIEHLVRLVEDEDLDTAQAERPTVDEVQEPPGRGDQHVDALRERALLTAERHAAEDDRRAQPKMAPIRLEAVGDLARELASGAEDQRPALPNCPGLPRLVQVVQHRQGERRRLARASLRDSEKIPPAHHEGDRLGLDRGGLRIALFNEGAKDRGLEAESGKV